jgi:fatty acid kinase fatty acid binding subunit
VTVRIVTDTAADIPPDLLRTKHITAVPLTVQFGSDSYLSGVDLGADEFWQKIRTTSEPPKTAAPSAGDFQKAYEDLARDGATGIVSLHLSSKLSATYQSAVVAANEVSGVPIEVVDTLTVSAAQGLLALHAAERAESGASVEEIVSDVDALRARVHLYGIIDTLEYLRMGGRIGGAQALLGTMLKFKPIISVGDGLVESVGRVRTRAKALEHLAGLVREHKDGIDRLVVIQGDATDTERFIALLDGIVHVAPSDVWTLGAVVGAHAGPGVIGVVFITSSS